jgi:Zn-dependent protease with chaperone function
LACWTGAGSHGAIDLHVVNDNTRNAYATGRRSIALTTRLIDDHRRGKVDDSTLAALICLEVGHLVTRGVRLSPISAWLAMP